MYCGLTDGRYMDILPNPRTRVPLSRIDGVPGSDYCNANYVRGPDGNPKQCVQNYHQMMDCSRTTTKWVMFVNTSHWRVPVPRGAQLSVRSGVKCAQWCEARGPICGKDRA
jgi:hypothetical protein